jgi:hypothetical protein
MERRTFVKIWLPTAVAGVVLAQTSKQDRLSGVVKSIDKNAMIIEMTMSKTQGAVRKVMYDANTRFTLDNKPAKADDVKESQRIVAGGKFDGVNLKASAITLKTR